MAAYRPAASQPAKVAGEFLGKKTGSVSDWTKALKVYTGVDSGPFGCVSFSKLCLWDAVKFFWVDWEQKSNNIEQYDTWSHSPNAHEDAPAEPGQFPGCSLMLIHIYYINSCYNLLS